MSFSQKQTSEGLLRRVLAGKKILYSGWATPRLLFPNELFEMRGRHMASDTRLLDNRK